MLRLVTDYPGTDAPRVIKLRERMAAQLAETTAPDLPTMRFGRDSHQGINDVVLKCTNVPLMMSRRHADITYDGEKYTLKDNETVNGTYVNLVMLPRGGTHTLKHGELVSFGGPATVMRDDERKNNPFRFLFLDSPEEENKIIGALEVTELAAQLDAAL